MLKYYAEARAIERIQKIQAGDDPRWETAIELGQKINIEKINARLKNRGYNFTVSCNPAFGNQEP